MAIKVRVLALAEEKSFDTFVEAADYAREVGRALGHDGDTVEIVIESEG